MGEDRVLQCLVQWGESRPDVRLVLLTSSRASPHAPVDMLSDYDIIVAVTDIRPYYEDRGWLDDFGPMLVVYRDPVQIRHGFESFAYITQYEGALKIDFSVSQVQLVQHELDEARRAGRLDPDLDLGLAVLLDKDGLAAGLPAPTYQAYIPSPPDEAEYRLVIELFFHEATYAVKNLWRKDLIPVKYFLDQAMKQDNLRRMLEWHVEIEAGWSLKAGVLGRGLAQRLRPDLRQALECTYVGAGWEENWQALFATVDLFTRMAGEVGAALGYPYPEDLERRMRKHFHWVKQLSVSSSG